MPVVPFLPAILAVAAPLAAAGIKNALTDKDAGQSQFKAQSFAGAGPRAGAQQATKLDMPKTGTGLPPGATPPASPMSSLAGPGVGTLGLPQPDAPGINPQPQFMGQVRR